MQFGSVEHVAVLAATVGLCLVAALLPRRRTGASWSAPAARALAVLLIGNEIAIRVVLLADGDFRWGSDLPLQLSDAALVAAAVALWTPRPPRLAFELTYFWAFSATLQAVLTPDLKQGPDDFFFWAFFIAHSGLLLAASYLTWGRRLAPERGAVRRVLIASLAWTSIAAIGTLATGGNYMFLREPPPGGSLLDLFGPWPWYLLGAAALAVGSFLLLARIRRSDPAAWWRGLGEMSPSGRPGVVMAWALYDFANTIFSFAVVSFAMSLWSIRFLGEGPGILWFTVALSASVLLNALVSPILGAMSDRVGRRKPFLAAFTMISVAATAVIGLVDIALGLILFAVANFAFQASLIYYDALLATVARPHARGRLSGLGGGLGYAGVLVAGVLLQFTTDHAGRITAASFGLVAALFGIVAVPALVAIREPGGDARAGAAAEARHPWRRLRLAFAGARDEPGLLRFVVARFFYSDPVNTAIAVMSAFAVAAVGFSEGQALNVLLVLVVVAVAASFAWGRSCDRIGAVPTLLVVLGFWAVGLALIAGFLAPVPFLVAGVVLGAGVGGIQVVERVVLTRLSPPERLAEMFGVYGLAGRASAVVGPIAYGVIVAALVEPLGRGAYQVAIVTLMVPLAIGYGLAWKLPRPSPPGVAPVAGITRAPLPVAAWRARVMRPALLGGAALVLAGALWALLQAVAVTTREERVRVTGAVSAVSLEVAQGDVEITAAPEHDVDALVLERSFLIGVARRTGVEDGTASLRWACRAWTACRTDLRVRVPERIAVEARTGLGDVRMRGPVGAVEIETGGGDVRAHALEGGRARVDSRRGDVTLAFSKPPSEVAVDASSGSVEVLVPAGSYRIDATTRAGEVRLVRIRHDPRAERSIVVETSAGDVTVRAVG